MGLKIFQVSYFDLTDGKRKRKTVIAEDKAQVRDWVDNTLNRPYGFRSIRNQEGERTDSLTITKLKNGLLPIEIRS
jgi:hypothetical protein